MLRSPRIDDARAWREVRLREQAQIEPWWVTSPLTWEERHSEAIWITHVLHARHEALAEAAMPLVVEIDGDFAGECCLEWFSRDTGVGEMGGWMDSHWAREGFSTVAAGMMVDHALTTLGLHRIVAPICEGNTAAIWGARRLGMQREGRMIAYLNVGGRRRDHYLWAMTADQLPEGGLAAAMAAGPGLVRRASRNGKPSS